MPRQITPGRSPALRNASDEKKPTVAGEAHSVLQNVGVVDKGVAQCISRFAEVSRLGHDTKAKRYMKSTVLFRAVVCPQHQPALVEDVVRCCRYLLSSTWTTTMAGFEGTKYMRWWCAASTTE